MVFLIKKNARGDRSISLKNNSNDIDLTGLLEALRGLTFKIEVKITDILKEEPVAPQASEKAGLTNLEKTNALVPEIPDKPKAPVQASTKIPIVEKNEPQKCLREDKTPIRKTVEPNPEEVVKKSPVPLLEKIVKPIAEIPEVKKQTQEKVVEMVNGTKPFVPQYPQGTVAVGSVIETCCIAVDDRSSPIFGYITFDDDQLIKICELITSVVERIEDSPEVTSSKVGDIVLAKSCDDNQWYRSVIEKVGSNAVDIFFFDWGLRETITIDRIRALSFPELKLTKVPACAVKLKFNAKSPEVVEEFLRCETSFGLRIDSFDELTKAYEVTVSKLHE